MSYMLVSNEKVIAEEWKKYAGSLYGTKIKISLEVAH